MSVIDRTQELERYMALPYPVELIPDPDAGGYIVSIPDLPGCLSQGETVDEAMEMIRDAQRGWLRVALEHGDPIPEPRSVGDYSGKFNVRVPKSLHRELVSLAGHEGVSLNALITTLLTHALSTFPLKGSLKGSPKGTKHGVTGAHGDDVDDIELRKRG